MQAQGIYFKLVLTTIFWAAVFHVGKFVVTTVSPPTVTAWRFLLAAAILLPLARRGERMPWTAIRRNALPLLAMSAIGVFGFNISTFYGLRSTSAVNAALIMALNPALTTILAALIGRERISMRQGTGLLMGIAGVAVVVSKGSWHALAGMSFSQGDLLILLASLCWAFYPVIPKRFIKGLSSMQVTASTIAGGAALMALFALDVAPDFTAVPALPVATGILFMGVAGTVVAYLWWNQGIQALGAQSVANFINLVPLFAAFIGLLLGEPVSWAQACGAVLVVSGVLYSSIQPASTRRALAQVQLCNRG